MSALFNQLLNNLPFEAHINKYSYCGPGTKLEKRLARGDKGINELDKFCKDHDIQYSQNADNLKARREADLILAEKAWQRVIAKDSKLGEKLAALGVTGAMRLKRKLGLGLKMKKKGGAGLLPLIANVASGAISLAKALKSNKRKGSGYRLKPWGVGAGLRRRRRKSKKKKKKRKIT